MGRLLKAKPTGKAVSAAEPGGDAGRKRSGNSGYCLGVVGERSSGDEGELRGSLERGEARIPE